MNNSDILNNGVEEMRRRARFIFSTMAADVATSLLLIQELVGSRFVIAEVTLASTRSFYIIGLCETLVSSKWVKYKWIRPILDQPR